MRVVGRAREDVIELKTEVEGSEGVMPGVASASGSGIWSRWRDEITFDRLQKFWNDLTPQARQELLKLDKQTFIEQARKNFYCSRCNGLLLECFNQIVMHGKSLQEAPEIDRLSKTADSKMRQQEQDAVHDPSGYPWGGLSTTKDGTLTLLDCFVKTNSLLVLQNVFDNARAREREREMLYPDACGACGRGWTSQGMASYSKGHGTREVCALHTARLSCDTLVDFWSALGEETRSSLLRLKEEDFIQKLMYRFDSKRFCRDCRRNVIREFKELKELKRMRWEPRCTDWFCVADTDFQCEVFEDAVIADWSQYLSEDVSYDHFEWAVGTDEGESDIFGFEDVGMNAQVQRNGINLDEFEDYFITLKAWRVDGHCNEFCVKAHALKDQSCVHHRLVVGDGFVTITKGESIRSFFEYAEEAEEEDEDDAMDRDGNDLDGGFHPQKHAKSPELAREFLLDAATIIFKEQVEKAFREGTARQNAQSVFVSHALKLLEERVHVACKEIITLEKQNKLLEEEEKEKREEQERRMKRRTKERQKKLRRKERLKEKGNDNEKRLVQLKSLGDSSSSALSNFSRSTNDESSSTLDSIGSSSDEEGNVDDICLDGELNGENSIDHCNAVTECSPMDSSDSCTLEQSRSSKRSPHLKKDFPQVDSCCYGDTRNEPGRIGDLQWQSKGRTRNSGGNCNLVSTTNNRTRDRLTYNPCSCDGLEDCRDMNSCFSPTNRSGREMKMARKAGVEKSGVQYRRHYPLNSYIVPVESHISGNQKNTISKQVWEPLDIRKKTNLNDTDGASGTIDNVIPLKPVDSDTGRCQDVGAGCEQLSLAPKSSSNLNKLESDQPFENIKRIEASCDGTPMKNEVSRREEEVMMNPAGSDSLSSSISEGDRESSSISMTSSATQNPESSLSDSEESSDRVNSILNAPSVAPSVGTPSRSLLETCAGKGFREYQPKVSHPAREGQFGFGISPFQDQRLHHQSINAPSLSPAAIGINNHSWVAPTDGNFHYAQPSYFPGSFMSGVPGSQFIDYPVQYSNVNPYMTSAFRNMPPGSVPQTAARFRAMPPSSLPFQNGGEQVACHPHRDMNIGHPSKPKSSGLKDFPENRNKSQDADASFSLFQFNLPIASPLTPSSEDDRSGEFAGKTSLAQVQGQLCSREQTDVKEYNLFSTKDSGMFTFMQRK